MTKQAMDAIDWNDDEAVVLAAIPNLPPDEDVPYERCWKEIRDALPEIHAFERQHNPAYNPTVAGAEEKETVLSKAHEDLQEMYQRGLQEEQHRADLVAQSLKKLLEVMPQDVLVDNEDEVNEAWSDAKYALKLHEDADNRLTDFAYQRGLRDALEAVRKERWGNHEKALANGPGDSVDQTDYDVANAIDNAERAIQALIDGGGE